MGLLKEILDTLFPEKCLRCKQKNETLCLPCAETFSNPKYFQKTLTFLPYKNSFVKKSIWLFKYSHRKSLSKTFAKLISSHVIEDLSDNQIFDNKETIIISIPSSAKRSKKIGYNQSDWLCGDISKIINIPYYKDVLKKKKSTDPQMSIKDKEHRLKNIKDSFYCSNKKIIKDKNIIIVDDVITTGATIAEAEKVLLKNQARSVRSYSISH